MPGSGRNDQAPGRSNQHLLRSTVPGARILADLHWVRADPQNVSSSSADPTRNDRRVRRTRRQHPFHPSRSTARLRPRSHQCSSCNRRWQLPHRSDLRRLPSPVTSTSFNPPSAVSRAALNQLSSASRSNTKALPGPAPGAPITARLLEIATAAPNRSPETAAPLGLNVASSYHRPFASRSKTNASF